MEIPERDFSPSLHFDRPDLPKLPVRATHDTSSVAGLVIYEKGINVTRIAVSEG
jgi:hypothetical protein